MDISYKKLIKQDADFEKFVGEVIASFVKNQPEEALRALYNFYTIGMDAKQVAEWLKRMQT